VVSKETFPIMGKAAVGLRMCCAQRGCILGDVGVDGSERVEDAL